MAAVAADFTKKEGTEEMSGRHEYKYDVFISYSHKAERELARTIEKTLWTFGRSWYQVRGLRTYRDESNLAAEPDLWPRIEEAVKQSRCLILLASANSARSSWVPREVEAAVERHGLEGVCIVQTGGVLPWTDRVNPEEMVTRDDAALSPSVWKRFANAGIEPLVVDMRLFRLEPQKRIRRNPEFLSRVASLAARALDVDKEKIWGDYHSAQRLRIAFLTAICVVLFSLLVAVGLLLRAEKRATNIATARYLAVEGLREMGQNHSRLGLVLLVESLRREQTPEALGGLFSAISQDPHLSQQRFALPTPAYSLAFSGRGDLIAAGHENGIVTLRSLVEGLGPLEKDFEAGKQLKTLAGGTGTIEFLVFPTAGSDLVGLTSAGEFIRWDISSTGSPIHKVTIGSGERHAEAEFLGLADHARVAIVGDYGADPLVLDADDDSLSRIDDSLCVGDPVSLDPNGDLLACGEASEKFRGIRVYERRTMKTEHELHLKFPEIATSLAFSASSGILAIGTDRGAVYLWRLQGSKDQPVTVLNHESDPYARGNAGLEVKLLQFSKDNRFLVTSYRGEGFLWHVPSGEMLTKLPGDEPTAFTFSQNGRYLAVSDIKARVRIWDLRVDSWIDWACRNADVDLGPDQWNRYLPGEVLPKPCATH